MLYQRENLKKVRVIGQNTGCGPFLGKVVNRETRIAATKEYDSVVHAIKYARPITIGAIVTLELGGVTPASMHSHRYSSR